MLDEILTADRVAVDVDCESWRDAVRACGALLVRAGDVEEPFIQSMIEVVEEFGPYMILAPKVAFFHGRPSEAVKNTSLSFITLKNAVVFEEYAGEVIKSAFAFGAIDKESHVQMLAGVAKLLQDKEFLELATENGSKQAILETIRRASSPV